MEAGGWSEGGTLRNEGKREDDGKKNVTHDRGKQRKAGQRGHLSETCACVEALRRGQDQAGGERAG